jgi:molecular chaperone DnaJ
MTLSFEEAAFGTEKEINVTKYDTCSDCSGTGAQSKNDIDVCKRCHGTGRVIVEQNSFMGRIRTETVCPECEGKGKTIKNKCTTCRVRSRENHSKIR